MVGVVGAGQLARMLLEAAVPLGIDVVVLAERPDDAGARAAAHVVLGAPDDRRAIGNLAEQVDVVTFDHELVDLAILAELEANGVAIRPATATLELAVDKGWMRHRLAGAGVRVPPFAVLDPADGPRSRLAAIGDFAAEHGWPVVLKTCRGGYDGRGVWRIERLDQAAEILAGTPEGTSFLLEPLVAIRSELAALVARRPGGDTVSWPVVETAQVGGVCREVLVPGGLEASVAEAAGRLGARVAQVVGAVGVLAVELFWTGEELLVNEIAARPHNSGHWTIEGAETSQFENHLRAVLDLPLGPTDPTAPAVASVNVFGADDGTDPAAHLGAALAVDGAHVHLYQKAPRPGRKLGHVTVRGTHGSSVRRRAWEAARALGTPVPAGLTLPPGQEAA